MTDRKKRPIVPELRSIPMTFMDCDLCENCTPLGQRKKKFGGVYDGKYDTKEDCCATRRLRGCPRGYAA